MAEPIDNYLIASHAAFEMLRRGIDEGVVRQVLAAPEQRHPVRPGRDVLQSRIALAGKAYLLRGVRRHRPRSGGGRHGLPHEPHR